MIGNNEEHSQRKASVSSQGEKPNVKILIENAQLKFKTEEDDQQKNPINI